MTIYHELLKKIKSGNVENESSKILYKGIYKGNNTVEVENVIINNCLILGEDIYISNDEVIIAHVANDFIVIGRIATDNE